MVIYSYCLLVNLIFVFILILLFFKSNITIDQCFKIGIVFVLITGIFSCYIEQNLTLIEVGRTKFESFTLNGSFNHYIDQNGDVVTFYPDTTRISETNKTYIEIVKFDEIDPIFKKVVNQSTKTIYYVVKN